MPPIVNKLITLGNPALRKICKPVKNVFEVQNVAKVLHEQVIENEGVGLAAPQINSLLRMFVMIESEDNQDNFKLVHNPEIKFYSSKIEYDVEGCLSIPDLVGVVPRSHSIAVTYINEAGKCVEEELDGFAARVFQHEYDHLNGILYIDHIEKQNLMKREDALLLGKDGIQQWIERTISK